MDLRVEDHEQPLQELRRLVNVHRAYQHMNNGDLAVEKGDVQGALQEYGAAEVMMPANLEMKYWHAVALVNAGRLEESLPIFRTVFTADPHWATLTPRLPKVGLLSTDSAGVARILSVTKRK
jgi:predicted Zn-dependent protease